MERMDRISERTEPLDNLEIFSDEEDDDVAVVKEALKNVESPRMSTQDSKPKKPSFTTRAPKIVPFVRKTQSTPNVLTGIVLSDLKVNGTPATVMQSRTKSDVDFKNRNFKKNSFMLRKLSGSLGSINEIPIPRSVDKHKTVSTSNESLHSLDGTSRRKSRPEVGTENGYQVIHRKKPLKNDETVKDTNKTERSVCCYGNFLDYPSSFLLGIPSDYLVFPSLREREREGGGDGGEGRL